MGHDIAGFAGSVATLRRLREPWPRARIFRLDREQQLAFLPIPDDETAEQDGVPDNYFLESDFAAASLAHFAACSAGAGLAWLKTDYYGGNGYQTAILWIDGAHVFGPLTAWNNAENRPPMAEHPINRALRGLGVTASGRSDEFLVFGLGRYRAYRDIAAEAEELVPPR